MKYVNAAEILPDKLLKELPTYAEGEEAVPIILL